MLTYFGGLRERPGWHLVCIQVRSEGVTRLKAKSGGTHCGVTHAEPRPFHTARPPGSYGYPIRINAWKGENEMHVGTMVMGGVEFVLLGFVLVGGPVLLMDWLRGRRQTAIERQIALTDALDEQLGAIVAPMVTRRLFGPWEIQLVVPYLRSAVMAPRPAPGWQSRAAHHRRRSPVPACVRSTD